MNKRQCVSCGAPIKIGATRCEYCGMTYDTDYWAGNIKYVPLHMDRMRLKAHVEVDNYILDALDKEAVARYAKNDLVHSLADGLMECMTIRLSNDILRDVTIVEGEVWVEKPDRRTAWM